MTQHERSYASPPIRRDILGGTEVYAMIDALGDVHATLTEAKPPALARLYDQLDVRIDFTPTDDDGTAVFSLGVTNERVRRGSRALAPLPWALRRRLLALAG